MKPSPHSNKAFLSTIYGWLDERGEVLVFFEVFGIFPILFTDRQQIQKKIEKLNKYYFEQLPYLSITQAFAVKNYDFPLRGIMDETLVEAELAMMSTGNGSEFLLLEKGEEGYYFGESITDPSELLDDLEDFRGKECVFGRYPKISASPVPGIQVEAYFPIDLEQ